MSSQVYPYQILSMEQYEKAYKDSVTKPEEFWASVAENFFWKKKFDRVLDWNFNEPKIKWFEGAKLNITENWRPFRTWVGLYLRNSIPK